MYQHGGDIYSYSNILDFSANINPLGIPERVKKAVAGSIEQLIHYPDSKCRKLRTAIADKEQIPNSWVLCGNGAADLLYTLCFALRPKRALLPVPSFLEYSQALSCCGCQIDVSFLTEETHFQITEHFLQDLKKTSYDIVFLCNPNNPTGQTIPPEILMDILSICEQRRTFLVIDECFLNFTNEYRTGSMVSNLFLSGHLLILKAFTKMYALPGLRLGYLLSSNTALLDKLETYRQPWSVSVPAQTAGIAALKETDWEEKTRSFIERERLWLTGRLPFSNITGKANFLFFRSECNLYQDCLEHGILIRDCNNFISLEGKHYYRIAVKKREENQQLVRLISSST